MIECEKCKLWDQVAKEAGKAAGICGDCFDRNFVSVKWVVLSEEKEPDEYI